MHPFYFGDGPIRLFGAYHSARGTVARPDAVVLCHPFGHEYIRAHRTLQTLATQLSDHGYHVLRFDYYGCGDSAGRAEDARVAQWISDIGTAIDELKDMSDAARVSLVGVRLGGTLAALVQAGRADVDTLVLWDPVLAGREYLEELTATEGKWLESRPLMQTPDRQAVPEELIGFPVSAALRQDLNEMDVARVGSWQARQVVEIVSAEAPEMPAPLHKGVAWSSIRVPVSCDWRQPASVHSALRAHEVVQAITAVFARGNES